MVHLTLSLSLSLIDLRLCTYIHFTHIHKYTHTHICVCIYIPIHSFMDPRSWYIYQILSHCVSMQVCHPTCRYSSIRALLLCYWTGNIQRTNQWTKTIFNVSHKPTNKRQTESINEREQTERGIKWKIIDSFIYLPTYLPTYLPLSLSLSLSSISSI